MSMLKEYLKSMCPCRVKSQEREDVDINKLVKHGAARIIPPQLVYADLTQIPESRGAAQHLLLEATRGLNQDLVRSLLALKPEEANAFIDLLRQASKRDEQNNANKTDLPIQGESNKTLGNKQKSPAGGPEAAGGGAAGVAS